MRPLLDFDGGAPESRLELEAALVLGALPRWTCRRGFEAAMMIVLTVSY